MIKIWVAVFTVDSNPNMRKVGVKNCWGRFIMSAVWALNCNNIIVIENKQINYYFVFLIVDFFIRLSLVFRARYNQIDFRGFWYQHNNKNMKFSKPMSLICHKC
jgi:hypothetical protein